MLPPFSPPTLPVSYGYFMVILFQMIKKIEIKNKRTKEQETKSIPTKSPHAYSYHRFCNFSMYISHRKVARMSQMVSCGPFLSTLFLHHPLSFPPPSILSHLLVFFRSLRNRKSEESHPQKTLHSPVGTKMEVSIPLRRREKKKKLIYGFCCGHICALLQFTPSLRFCYFVPLKAMNLQQNTIRAFNWDLIYHLPKSALYVPHTEKQRTLNFESLSR